MNAGATGCAFDAPSPGISAGVACGTPHTPRPAEAATIRRERSQAGPLRRAAVSRTGRGPGGPSAQGRRSASWDREDVALEATPVALVRSEVAASPAARSVGLEGMELRPSPRGDLQHLAAIEVARVDDEGDAWVSSSSCPSLDHPPVSHQKARPSHRYQSGRTLGPVRPTVATRATRAWPRNSSRSMPSSTVHVVLAPPPAMQR